MNQGHDNLQQLQKAFYANPESTVEGCPAPDRIAAAVHQELSPDEFVEVLDHISACPSCTEDWRLAKEIFEEPRAAPFRHRSWQGQRTLAAAALVLLVVGLGWWQWGMRQETRFRQDETPRIESLLINDGISKSDPVLRWRGFQGARYNLLVATEDLEPLLEREDLDLNEYRIPQELLDPLPIGTRLLWRVTASTADGQEVDSPTFVVTVR